MLLVDGSSHQSAVGAGGVAAHLGEDGDIAHAGGDQNFFKLLADALAEDVYKRQTWLSSTKSRKSSGK